MSWGKNPKKEKVKMWIGGFKIWITSYLVILFKNPLNAGVEGIRVDPIPIQKNQGGTAHTAGNKRVEQTIGSSKKWVKVGYLDISESVYVANLWFDCP